VVTEIQYVEMLERLFARSGAQLRVSITRYSFGKWQNHEYNAGDLTYDYDSAFQVRVCMWLDSLHSRCEPVESPTPIVTPAQEAAFEEPLRAAVESLLQQPEIVGGSRG
jgi:hypothetical protein